MEQWLEYIIIGVYLAFMFAIGIIFKRFNSGDDDYFRSGCRGSWWLVGMSIFMSGISVGSFTLNAGLAFEGGWSVCLIYIGNAVMFTICWLFLGARFRRIRRITFAQVILDRFGVSLQQGLAYYNSTLFLLFGALQLYALSIFANGVFDLPVIPTIILIGIVVGFYSASGGNWAVISTDFLQGIVLFPVTILITFFCLKSVGGIPGFFEAIREAGLQQDFQFIKPAGAFDNNKYSPLWLTSLLTIQIVANLGMTSTPRFFACKDDKAASKASLLCAILMLVGAVLWFVPPMTARILFEDQVLASEISDPGESSYAVAARNFLPPGLMGLMMVAMFGASMSTMDTALNRNSAMIVEDIIPALRRVFKKGDRLAPLVALRMGRIFTLLFAAGITGIAILMAEMSGVGAFDVGFKLNNMTALPSMTPLFLGIFIMRTPRWAGWASFGVGLLPSLYSIIFPDVLSTHVVGLLCFGFALAAFFLTMPFWKSTPESEKEKSREFFTRMATPVDFEKEVGRANDGLQLRILGTLCLSVAAFILLILLIPNSLADRLSILFVSVFIGAVGAVLLAVGLNKKHREQ